MKGGKRLIGKKVQKKNKTEVRKTFDICSGTGIVSINYNVLAEGK